MQSDVRSTRADSSRGTPGVATTTLRCPTPSRGATSRRRSPHYPERRAVSHRERKDMAKKPKNRVRSTQRRKAGVASAKTIDKGIRHAELNAMQNTAIAFTVATKMLADDIRARGYRHNDATPVDGGGGRSHRDIWRASSAVAHFNLHQSFEAYIKFILAVEGSRVPPIHPLAKLYERLSCESKAKLDSLYAQIIKPAQTGRYFAVAFKTVSTSAPPTRPSDETVTTVQQWFKTMDDTMRWTTRCAYSNVDTKRKTWGVPGGPSTTSTSNHCSKCWTKSASTPVHSSSVGRGIRQSAGTPVGKGRPALATRTILITMRSARSARGAPPPRHRRGARGARPKRHAQAGPDPAKPPAGVPPAAHTAMQHDTTCLPTREACACPGLIAPHARSRSSQRRRADVLQAHEPGAVPEGRP